MSYRRYPAYRDSGVEWLGEVPAHWELRKLKFVVTCNDEVLPENTAGETEINYVEISDVSEEHGIESMQLLQFQVAPSRARRLVRTGDTIVSTVRTYLKAIACISGGAKGLVVSTGFAVLRPTPAIDSLFLGYFCHTPFFWKRLYQTRWVSAIRPQMHQTS